jgi:hypothetical protein
MTLINFRDERIEYPTLAPSEVYPSRAPAQNFIDAIRGRSANRSPGTLGLASMEIIEAACRSAKTGRNIKIRDVKLKGLVSQRQRRSVIAPSLVNSSCCEIGT